MGAQDGYTPLTRALMAAQLMSPPWLLARMSLISPLEVGMYWHSFKQPIQHSLRMRFIDRRAKREV